MKNERYPEQLPLPDHPVPNRTVSIHRFRQNTRALNQKLHRSVNSDAKDYLYNKRTVGLWKTKHGQKYYVNLKGEELSGAAARNAFVTDEKAKCNRIESANQGFDECDTTSLCYWRIPKEIQQIYSRRGIQKLYCWQAEALSLPGVADGTRNFLFSTPTSSGKSLISEILLIRHLIFQKKKCFIVLPFVSLVEEKLLDLQSKIYPIGCTCKAFHSNIAPILTEEVDVAVCTIEKASLMLDALITSRRLTSITSVIIDELHYISDPQRGHLLEIVISKIMLAKRFWELPLQIIGMSATLPNFVQVAQWLDAVYYSSDYRPVPLYQHYVLGNAIFNAEHRQLRTFPSSLNNTDITVTLVQEVLQNRHSAIVFVATKLWCVNLMATLAEHLILEDDLRRAELLEQMREEMQGSICPKLENGVLKGVAYHNSDLPMPIRRLIEDGFRTRVILCLCATSTIAAGVNLPARRVIFRSQYVARQLLSASQYQQMAGRAGRANLDDLGESFLVCEGTSKDVVEKIRGLISSPPAAICSQLIAQKNFEKMTKFVLDGICLDLCNVKSGILRFMTCTLWGVLNSDQDGLQVTAEKCLSYLIDNNFVKVVDGTYAALDLGRATSACGFSCSDALLAFESLGQARLQLCTASPLQLAFLSTPPHSSFFIASNLALQQKTMENLSSIEQDIARAVGVDPFITFKSMGITLQLDSTSNPSMRKCRRLILAKVLCDVVEGKGTTSSLSEKYKIAPGDVQNLQTLSSTMANMSSVFCQHLRWDGLALLLARFAQLLSFGCSDRLLPFFVIPNMTVFWANTLIEHEFQSPEDIASRRFEDFLVVLQKSASQNKVLKADYVHSVALSFYESSVAIRDHKLLDPTVKQK